MQDDSEKKYENFGQRLKLFRLQAGYATPEELGERMGVSRSTAFQWEKRDKPVHPKYWAGLCEALGVSESRLLGQNSSNRISTGADVVKPEAEIVNFFQEFGDEASLEEMKLLSRYSKTKQVSQVQDVLTFLRPWLLAAMKDPDVAPYLLSMLRKHFPHSDIEKIVREE